MKGGIGKLQQRQYVEVKHMGPRRYSSGKHRRVHDPAGYKSRSGRRRGTTRKVPAHDGSFIDLRRKVGAYKG